MNKKELVLLAIILDIVICTVFMSSCSASITAPSELIKRPSLSIDDRVAFEVIQSNLPNSAELVRPLHPGELTAVGTFNWDKDGKKEVYAFYKNEQNRVAGVILLKFDEGIWKLISKLELPGTDVSFAKFIDFNSDGINDILFGTEGKDGIYSVINAYVWSDGSYKEVWHDVFTELLTFDFDMDGTVEFVNIKLDRASFSSISVFRYADNTFKLLDEIDLDMYIGGYYNVMYGMLHTNIPAVILDFNLGSSSASNAITFENGKLHAVIDPFKTSQKYDETAKWNMIKSRDIDRDGIVEVAKNYELKYYRGKETKHKDLYSWAEFQGYQDKTDDLFQIKALSYINSMNYFEFIFPDKWIRAAEAGDFIVIKSSENDKRNFVSFYCLGKEDNPILLLTFEVFSLEEYDNWLKSDITKNYKIVEMASGVDYKIVAYRIENGSHVRDVDKPKYQSLEITEDEIKFGFSLIR